MASKTRDKLIEVARQLFVRKGVANTTMQDIAQSSDYGRRTLYTYFRNKREIQQAVAERESDLIVQQEKKILKLPISPSEKLSLFLKSLLEAALNHTPQSSPFLWLSILESDRLEKTRKMIVHKEMMIFQSILDEGVQTGCFNPVQVRRAAPFFLLLRNFVELTWSKATSIRETLELPGQDTELTLEQISDFIVEALSFKEIPRNHEALSGQAKEL